jgi:hypothetical protein
MAGACYKMVPFQSSYQMVGNFLATILFEPFKNWTIFDQFMNGYCYFSWPVHFVWQSNGWLSDAQLKGKMDHFNYRLVQCSSDPKTGQIDKTIFNCSTI